MDKSVLDEASLKRLNELNNRYVLEIVEKYVKLCKPLKVMVLDDSKESLDYVRKLAVKNKEETPLKMKGHTTHFDGYNDQGRDLQNTRVLLPKGKKLSKAIETLEREQGLKEIFALLDGIMEGKEMLVKFY